MVTSDVVAKTRRSGRRASTALESQAIPWSSSSPSRSASRRGLPTPRRHAEPQRKAVREAGLPFGEGLGLGQRPGQRKLGKPELCGVFRAWRPLEEGAGENLHPAEGSRSPDGRNARKPGPPHELTRGDPMAYYSR